eukprot:TRINITY_DN7313_c0_g1_i4.p1 TRINITY_DN7313_c0_g1~~TRINITY_DN7313_c0_g1_i4.p1  ORF type:complete len:867 (-),score=134.27 TRINITY_DN7313_c0_g1_i4:348-2948(-)
MVKCSNPMLGQVDIDSNMVSCKFAMAATQRSREDGNSLQSFNAHDGGTLHDEGVPAGTAWIWYALYFVGGVSVMCDVARWTLSRAHIKELRGEPSLSSPFTWQAWIPFFIVEGCVVGLQCQLLRHVIREKLLRAALNSRHRFRSSLMPCLVGTSTFSQLGNWLLYKVKLVSSSPASSLSQHAPFLVLDIFELVWRSRSVHHWLMLELKIDELACSRTAQPAPSLHEKFAADEQRDSKKFELVYIVAEALYVVTYMAMRGFAVATSVNGMNCLFPSLCSTSEGGDMYFNVLTVLLSFLDILAPAGLLLRIYHFWVLQLHNRTARNHCEVHASLRQFDLYVRAFLVFNHIWFAAIAGLVFSDSSASTSFVINNMLSFLCTFVLSLREAFVLAPLAFLAYILGNSFACFLLEQSSLGHIMHAIFLALGLSLSVAARWAIHQSKWKAFQLLEEISQDAIQQKVLRCKAEFELEIFGCATQHPRCPSSLDGVSEGSSCLESSAKSLKSAPAAIVHLPGLHSIQEAHNSQEHDLPGTVNCEAGDCLPATSLVWVEGEAKPRAVQSLRAEERVLCFDRLAQGLKYAPVVNIQLYTGIADWAKIKLADGTEVNVTADHPLRTARAMNSPYQAIPRRAAELEAGSDQLLVMKAASVVITSVERFSADAPRVSIALNQPERHALFVCEPGSATSFHACAVESVDAFAHGVNIWSARTFVHAGSNAGPNPSVPGSSPASLCPSVVSTPRSLINPGDPPPCIIFGGVGAAMPSASGAACVQEAATVAAEANQPVPAGAELSSMGSRFHAQGCKPCAQQNKFQHRAGNPCRNGAACGFCHEFHADIRWTKKERRRELFSRGKVDNLKSSSMCFEHGAEP